MIKIILFCFIFLHPCFANAQDLFNLSSDDSINVNISNKPLNEVLRNFSSKFSIELKGYSVGNEVVNLNLSNASLNEVLKRMMRGYNYVLIKPDSSKKTVLMVLSKAERTKYADAPTAASPPPPPIAAPPIQQSSAATIPPRPPQTTTTQPSAQLPPQIPTSTSTALTSAPTLAPPPEPDLKQSSIP